MRHSSHVFPIAAMLICVAFVLLVQMVVVEIIIQHHRPDVLGQNLFAACAQESAWCSLGKWRVPLGRQGLLDVAGQRFCDFDLISDVYQTN